jgi:hypothetical protein
MRTSIVLSLISLLLISAPLSAHAIIPVGGHVIKGLPCTNGGIYVIFAPSGGYIGPVIYQAGVTIPYFASPALLLKPGTGFLGSVVSPSVCVVGTVPMKGMLLIGVGTGL